jgi:hypothetical protein
MGMNCQSGMKRRMAMILKGISAEGLAIEILALDAKWGKRAKSKNGLVKTRTRSAQRLSV